MAGNKNLIIGSVYEIITPRFNKFGPYLYLGEDFKEGCHKMLDSNMKICYWDFEDIFLAEVNLII